MRALIVLTALVAGNAFACDIGSKDYQECLMREQQLKRIEQNTQLGSNAYQRSGHALGKLIRHRREKKSAEQK